jgi:hypothetical protein
MHPNAARSLECIHLSGQLHCHDLHECFFSGEVGSRLLALCGGRGLSPASRRATARTLHFKVDCGEQSSRKQSAADVASMHIMHGGASGGGSVACPGDVLHLLANRLQAGSLS